MSAIRDAALHYADIGLKLVPLRAGEKVPDMHDWPNHPITTPKGVDVWWGEGRRNVGVDLGASGLCSLDPDCLSLTRELLEMVEIDVEEVLDQGWRIFSREGHGRAEYRVPAGLDLSIKKYTIPMWKARELGLSDNTVAKDNQRFTIFELRAGAGKQDVLPPSIHPSTNAPYTSNLILASLSDIPELPPDLIDLWARYEDHTRVWDAHLRIADQPRVKTEGSATLSASLSENVPAIQSAAAVTIAAWNDLHDHDFDELLERHGYEAIEDRWLAPASTTGKPGVYLAKDGRHVFSTHGSDLLGATDSKGNLVPHDLFDCFRILEHDGSWPAALRAAEREVGHTLAAVEFGSHSTEAARARVVGRDVKHGTATTRPLTEAGNSDRLADICAGRVMFVPERKEFLLWGGGSWSTDGAEASGGAWILDEGTAHLTALAKSLPTLLFQEAATLMDGGGLTAGDIRSYSKWVEVSGKAQTIRNAIALFERSAKIRVPLSNLDADPLLVGFNGAREVIDLRTGRARLAMPDDRLTKSLGVSELGVAEKAVTWLQFLDEVFVGDAELIDWIQRFTGYALSGLTSEHLFLFFYGHGRNGKSVFVAVLRYILGDYGKTLATESLMSQNRQAQAASPDLAMLAGARLVAANETEEGSALAESRIKQLTGGDSVSARFLYGTPFEFQPAFKIVISGNHRPIIKGTDSGIWRRMCLVPFDRTFAADEVDPAMKDRLVAEAHHILAWMLVGYQRWLLVNLEKRPARVKMSSAGYQADMDTVGEWIEDYCTLGSQELFSSSQDLFCAYSLWAERCGLHRPNKQAFARKLSERAGLSSCKRGGVRGFMGIVLKEQEFMAA